MLERRVIAVEGVVQGVGFRPWVFGLARRLDLRGFVRNDAAGVLIDVEGDRMALDRFRCLLTVSPPPLAAIDRVRERRAAPHHYADFSIAPLTVARDVDGDADAGVAIVAADAATCDACVAELFDPAGRRYRYPFLSCTSCGPRLTIVHAAPYDRVHTTMAPFPLCAACHAEFTDPQDRRFHAEALACPACGPRLHWCAAPIEEPGPLRAEVRRVRPAPCEGEAALRAAIAALRDGLIVAVKGVGGFHLACDATSSAAVSRLRARKCRPAKPFAVLARDIDTIKGICDVSAAEEALLLDVARPIVLLQRRPQAAALADASVPVPAVSPGLPTLGVMLPYTPLHHLLAAALPLLVMTSGNRSDEPITIDDADALRRLGDVADGFLLHDRTIALRCDDSVAAVIGGAPAVLRRSRGYAPRPLRLPACAAVPLIAVGGQLKNTFCLVRGRAAFLSPHVGDLGEAAAHAAVRDGIDHYTRLFDARPRLAVHDLHPDYASTRLAAELDVDERLAVQHHHAHVASCMAEHDVTEPVIGVAFDGTGLGTDGAIWGGEFLLVEGTACRRLAHLENMPLPGGDAAIRHPARMALSYLHATFGTELDLSDLPPFAALSAAEVAVVRQLVERRLHAPLTSSAGRLFDGVASITGLRHRAAFEGQAAMELEAAAGTLDAEAYPVELTAEGDGWVVELAPIVRAVVADARAAQPLCAIAARFHATMCSIIVVTAGRIRQRTGVRRIALTGGTFQNRRLTAGAAAGLHAAGFDVLLHGRVPCNDGGLALGQAYLGALHVHAD